MIHRVLLGLEWNSVMGLILNQKITWFGVMAMRIIIAEVIFYLIPIPIPYVGILRLCQIREMLNRIWLVMITDMARCVRMRHVGVLELVEAMMDKPRET